MTEPCATSSSELEVKGIFEYFLRHGERLLTISEVARRSGVASSALRFYEERGLIASERAGSGHRRYPRSALRRIAFIVFAQRIGLSLEEIGAELAKLPPDRVPTRARLGEALEQVDGADRRSGSPSFSGCGHGLTECIGCGCLSIDRCKLANPGGPASGRGRHWMGRPGPR